MGIGTRAAGSDGRREGGKTSSGGISTMLGLVSTRYFTPLSKSELALLPIFVLKLQIRMNGSSGKCTKGWLMIYESHSEQIAKNNIKP